MWNPKEYDKFEKERMLPIWDLISRIRDKQADTIIDLGCGSGFSTKALGIQWPKAKIVGVDMSETMLEQAKQRLNTAQYFQKDCNTSIEELGTFDIVFSTAMIQWLYNQEEFISQMKKIKSETGVVAVQIPDFEHMKICKCIQKVTEDFLPKLKNIKEKSNYNYTVEEYYDMFAKYYEKVEVWKIYYQHELTEYEELVSFISSTALNPIREELSEEEFCEFTKKLIQEVSQTYKRQKNGKILYEFRRIFITAE